MTAPSPTGSPFPSGASAGAAPHAGAVVDTAVDAERPTPVGRVQTALLWIAFVGVHVWLAWAVRHGPHTPLNDVSTVYRDWVQAGLDGQGWVGVDRPWVYPTLALVPMLAAASFGIAHFSVTWLVLVVVLDAIGFAVLTRGGTRRGALGWWWLAFLLLLGPIAVGRLDTVSVPIALIGLLFVAARPVLGSVLLTVAVWIKFWPVAPIVALLVAGRRRLAVLVGAVGTTVVVVVVALVVGGRLRDVFGFVTQQTGRGLQVEAPVTTFWLWLEMLHVPGTSTYFDETLLTYQVRGPGETATSALMTPIQGLMLLGIVVLGIWAVRRRATPVALLGPLALALTTTLIVGNKVGSPQYEPWLAVCVLFGFVLARRGGPSFAVPGALVLVIALLTQVIYPWGYDYLLLARPWMVVVITVRNVLLVALLAVGVRQVWLAGRGLGRAGSGAGSETSARSHPVVSPATDVPTVDGGRLAP